MTPLNKEAGLLTSVRVVSVEEQPSVHKHGGERFYSGCFLHILSKSEHGPEGCFAVPLNLTQERICFSHESKGHWHGCVQVKQESSTRDFTGSLQHATQ